MITTENIRNAIDSLIQQEDGFGQAMRDMGIAVETDIFDLIDEIRASSRKTLADTEITEERLVYGFEMLTLLTCGVAAGIKLERARSLEELLA